MKTIHYVSAPAGSGKTHQLVHHSVAEAQKGQKYLIAQPTIELIQQTLRKIKGTGFAQVKAIYKQFDYDSVAPKISSHMQGSVPDEGEILLITHEALRRIKDKGMLRHWHLVVDEFMGVFEHIQQRIALTHKIVTDHLMLSDEVKPGVSVVLARNPVALEALMANRKEDQNVENFLPLLNPVHSADHKVYVSTERYNDLVSNPDTEGKVDFFAILEPTFVEPFKTATFLGANAEETEMFILWQHLFDVKWTMHSELTKGLLYTQHKSGPRLTISYLFDNVWSKTHAKSGDEEGTTLDKVRAFIEKHFENEKFLWHANAMVIDTFFDAYSRLPNMAHGIDKEEFRKCNRVVLLSALNRRDEAYKFLDSIGIDPQSSHAMISYQADYQAMMRCSLRDPKAIAAVEVVVGSKGNAEWLEKRFPGCTVRQLDHGIAGAKRRGRPKSDRPMTSTERSQKKRAEAKLREQAIFEANQAAAKRLNNKA